MANEKEKFFHIVDEMRKFGGNVTIYTSFSEKEKEKYWGVGVDFDDSRYHGMQFETSKHNKTPEEAINEAYDIFTTDPREFLGEDVDQEEVDEYMHVIRKYK